MWLSKRVHGVKKGRPTINGKQTWCYRFPPLAECRQEFEDRFGAKLDWPEDTPALTVISAE